MKVFIGHDPREAILGYVAEDSINLYKSTDFDVEIIHLKTQELRRRGLFTRPWHVREGGQYVDVRDGKPFSTQFSHTRFLVPTLCRLDNYKGLALFIDSDFLFLDDIKKLAEEFDSTKAVQVVKHNYEPSNEVKMDGQAQLRYGRKLWSSMMLFNMQHSANEFLTADKVNNQPGSWLHPLGWLRDQWIGELSERWNFVVNHSEERVDHPGAVHFTEGAPLWPKYQEGKWAALWREHYERFVEGHRYDLHCGKKLVIT